MSRRKLPTFNIKLVGTHQNRPARLGYCWALPSRDNNYHELLINCDTREGTTYSTTRLKTLYPRCSYMSTARVLLHRTNKSTNHASTPSFIVSPLYFCPSAAAAAAASPSGSFASPSPSSVIAGVDAALAFFFFPDGGGGGGAGPPSLSSMAMSTPASPNPRQEGMMDSAVRWAWCCGSGGNGSCFAITALSLFSLFPLSLACETMQCGGRRTVCSDAGGRVEGALNGVRPVGPYGKVRGVVSYAVLLLAPLRSPT